MRKLWDARFQDGHMLARYDRTTFAFYTVMKGMSWIVYPRSICGAQMNVEPEDGDPQGERLVIQTSVDEPEWAPEQKGQTRATLTLSGWQLKCVLDSLSLSLCTMCWADPVSLAGPTATTFKSRASASRSLALS